MNPIDSPHGARARRRIGRARARLQALLAGLGLCMAATLGAAGPVQATHDGGPGTTADSTIIDSTGIDGRTVAFTFDDGPNPANTPGLLQLLRENGTKAVFCLWGDHVRQYPDLVRQIAADGHTLCNHSMHHSDMGSWTPEQIRADLEQTSAAIRAAVPGAPIPYFRAPNGSWGQTPAVAASLGMQPLGWRLAINDWEPSTADQLAQRLRSGITPGAVVLLHDGGGDRSATVAAVDMIIPEFASQGWTFTLPAPPR
ncbi:polysaccharide deacetylase family protein [Streptomyces johnsoniae]|uniref:Polysaccharide deacetylase family protein n=1 Tax=Streptomyces johnsoniae TaxID=3075532 RepID=A0ABU2SB82_9ACTN|nr:polysaccharide deacetylase family protein [Streptomyces sp. DSM 41886]MDT0446232.1 polysaccharide deacetylase family protein [Streptomyces sp. DSM 41886]